MSYKVPSPSELTYGRGNHDEEAETLTASTARRIFEGKVQLPSLAATEVEGILVVAASAGRSVEVY